MVLLTTMKKTELSSKENMVWLIVVQLVKLFQNEEIVGFKLLHSEKLSLERWHSLELVSNESET